MIHENAKTIKLNDDFRTSMVNGAYVFTSSIAALSPADLGTVLYKVREYSTFTDQTDYEQDHSRGVFEHNGMSFVWEINYFDPQIDWSVDPEDPETHRVLTVMLASEE